jgi:hypothetical protein
MEKELLSTYHWQQVLGRKLVHLSSNGIPGTFVKNAGQTGLTM